MNETKQCNKCKRTKAVVLFSPVPGKPGKYRSRCKDCRAEDQIARTARLHPPDPATGITHAQRRYEQDGERMRASSNAWKARKRQELSDYALGWKYGIEPSEAQRLLFLQEGLCAICKRSLDGMEPVLGSVRRIWSIDHCHESGQVRGILCRMCNFALGAMKDDPAILAAAIRYLADPPAKKVLEQRRE